MSIDYNEKIPNNVNLSTDKALQRALEHWLPNYLNWWKKVGPEGAQQDDVYLRTAVSADASGWAHFDYVKMPDYRWGIFLSPQEADRKINFGEHKGEPAWQDIPGEHRATLRRIVVTQGAYRLRCECELFPVAGIEFDKHVRKVLQRCRIEVLILLIDVDVTAICEGKHKRELFVGLPYLFAFE